MRRPISPEASTFVARYALQLAGMTRKATWLDGLVTVFTAVRRPFPAQVIDELETSWRRLPALNVAGLRGYVDVLRASDGLLSPAEQVLVHRITAVEQAVSAGR